LEEAGYTPGITTARVADQRNWFGHWFTPTALGIMW
jgi:hypothetical protein